MTCFSQLMQKTGRRLIQQTGLHLFAHFSITLAQTRTADRSFGANGSSPVRTDGSILFAKKGS
jgi:hypothetical protein